MHWKRWRRHGNPLRERPTPEARFWSYVEKGEDCWSWTAGRYPDGYGKFQVGGRAGREVLAHRFAYELLVGPIPDGLFVLHRCDNPPCVKPAHLFLGTQAENIADMVQKGRRCSTAAESNGNAKLTWAQVATIRQAASTGITQRVLAERFGVRQSTICQIVRYKHWVTHGA